MLNKINPECLELLPEAVLFDTDNTLYDYYPANHKAVSAVADKINNLIGVTSKDFYSAYSLARNQIKTELGTIASSHSRLLYFQRVLEILGFKAQLMIALDLEQTFWRTFLSNAPLFPGVLELLQLLRLHNIPIAIITDLTSHIQLRKLTYFNLEDTFDAVVTSEEAGADKPDRRNFELTLKKLNLSNKNHTWMIGDNPKTDILGGKTIDAITFQKLHRGASPGFGPEQPDYTFDDFLDVIQLFKKFITNPI
tara:strand:+ start:114 stop:869 length:756 start_codon:yes stop_codon:yes gene_type:complete